MIAKLLKCPPSEQDTWSYARAESAFEYIDAMLNGEGGEFNSG